MAGERDDMQPWVRFKGGLTSAIDLYQPEEDWKCTAGNVRAAIDTRVTQCSNATIVIETAICKEGPWTTLTSFTQATDDVTYADTTADAGKKIQKLLRWRIERSAAVNWEACFRIGVASK